MGVSSADCLAAQARSEGLNGEIGVVIDAQRGEFYLANYTLSASGWVTLQPLRLVSRTEVEACSAAGQLLLGPEVSKWFPESRTMFPDAAVLGRMPGDFVPAESLQPIYLREPKFVKVQTPLRKT
jgi:tRNA A37 threonylcarbamoyladenosine modification protein TsaB